MRGSLCKFETKEKTVFSMTASRRAVTAAVVLSLTGLAAVAPDSALAFPDRPLTIVVPAGTGGTNDRAARLMANHLAEELGQPVQVVNRPGGGNLLGHVYFQQQPADGYTLVRTTAIPYMTINQIVQGADFVIEDFQPINITDIGTSILATSNDSPYETIFDLVEAIRENPGSISVGVQPTATDFINLTFFLEALGLTTDDVRVVTYDSGGPVRNGIIGGQFDVGAIGDQGMAPRQGEFRPLMSFAEERSPIWDAPTVLEVMEAEGVADYPRILSGSMQGYFLHTALMEAYPDRYERLVAAFEAISQKEAAIAEHEAQALGIEWLGPERSREMMLRAHAALDDPEILNQLE